jgi:hypothetical protein
MENIKLEYPLMVHKAGELGQPSTLIEVRELSLGRLKAKHLKLMPDSIFESDGKSVKPHEVIPLIAGLADIPIESVEEMDVSDLMKVGEALGSFLSDSLQTGNN